MRRLFTVLELERRGVSRSALRTAVGHGRLTKVEATVYAVGPEPVSAVDCARAAVLATGGVACGTLAGSLLGLEGVCFDGPHLVVPLGGNGHRSGAERRSLPAARICTVEGVRCTDALQTLTDLAAVLSDVAWEQALESALRRKLVGIGDVATAASRGGRGARRMRRVLDIRPPGAPATESLLETLMVQLVRTIPGLPSPQRQVVVVNPYGEQVARVDLAWCDLGLFVELDGQHHKGQPVYDARRETAVVAATGWLCGRFTWHEVVDIPIPTARRVVGLVDQARRRPRSS